MTELQSFELLESIHFTGICGVGMTALALCLQDKGVAVSGSDTGEAFVTSSVLASRNILVGKGFAPLASTEQKDGLVYTGSHGGAQNPQVLAAQREKIPVYSHAKALGLLSHTKKTIAVCGIGGKTTTSAMVATIFEMAQRNPSYAIGVGGVSTLAFPGKWDPSGEHFIAEADEYATSPGTDATPRFMALAPHTIICTGIAHDHPDIYDSLEAVKQAFARFFDLLPNDGLLVVCGDSEALRSITANLPKAKTLTYGCKDYNDWQIVSTRINNQLQEVAIKDPQGKLHKLLLRVPGTHNALNALSAYIVADMHGISGDSSALALGAFAGTKRRFEIIGDRNGITFVDDYAHHPNEIQATLTAAKAWFKDRRIIVVFQPHTFSRTKTLLPEFAHSFLQANHVLVADIFASAREHFDPTISASMLADEINTNSGNARFVADAELKSAIKGLIRAGDVVITMGAGDIYKLHEQLSGEVH